MFIDFFQTLGSRFIAGEEYNAKHILGIKNDNHQMAGIAQICN